MELDLSWLLWALPLAFAGGWLTSRFDARQWKLASRSAPKSYFKGLNHLLNEEQDQAIDAFIEAVQQDPDTTELHFALGNLFRRRGDHDRAVRVHQHLLQRGDLSQSERDRAQHALAMDFLRAGLLDRAEASLQPLMGTAYETEARLTLLGLYERTREWDKALATAQALAGGALGSFTHRAAHHRCELAQEALARGDTKQALALLTQAQAAAPDHPRPHLELGKLLAAQGQTGAALTHLWALAQHAPQALPLAAPHLAQWATAPSDADRARALLTEAQQKAPCIDHVEALAALVPEARADTRAGLFLSHLAQGPSLAVAADWLNLPSALPPEALPDPVRQAVNQAAAPLRRYRCAACGFEAGTHFWQCPGCQTWDSYSPRRVADL